jgi:hypothetical protein
MTAFINLAIKFGDKLEIGDASNVDSITTGRFEEVDDPGSAGFSGETFD